MKEVSSEAMPPCFEKWCRRFDDIFRHQAQRKEFRYYLGGLLGESERKNLSQITRNTLDASYHGLRHFLVRANWGEEAINERRLAIVNSCRQSRISNSFALIVDDSGHRKSGNLTDGVGRQYIGEIGKTDNGIVVVTSHIYDGTRSLPLDVALYQHANSLAQGKQDPEFKKKPELALELIDKCLWRSMRPSLVLIDAGYGNNGNFLQQLESRNLKYLGGIAKNRQITMNFDRNNPRKLTVERWGQSLQEKDFTPVELQLNKPKTVWVAVAQVEISSLEGQRTVAIVMNAPSWEKATDIDYFITNIDPVKATPQWIASTYSQRNWVEVFYREAKGWLGLKEYQVRGKRSLYRHFILVFTAYTFVIWQKLTGGLRRQWATQPLTTFTETLEAFRSAISCRFVSWLSDYKDVFANYKASLGLVWL
jgi:SRSO17 transposase